MHTKSCCTNNELITLSARLFLGFILVMQGLSKAFAFDGFIEMMQSLMTWSSLLVTPAAVIITTAEIVIGFLLILGVMQRWSLFGAVLLFIVINAGIFVGMENAMPLIMQNAIFVIVALIGLKCVRERSCCNYKKSCCMNTKETYPPVETKIVDMPQKAPKKTTKKKRRSKKKTV
ncbi:MAG: DoxX family protein [Candidatus Woesearchaeota archaeon]